VLAVWEVGARSLYLCIAAVVVALAYYFVLVAPASLAAALSLGHGNVLLSSLLTAFALLLLSRSSTANGRWLFATLAVFVYVHLLMMQLEAVFFGLMTPSIQAIVGLLVIVVLLVGPFCIAVALSPRPDERTTAAISDLAYIRGLASRVALCSIVYAALYFLAGVTILPFVREFYGALVPPILEIVAWQLLRGAIYASASLLLIRHMKGTSVEIATTLAVAFPILGGVAPLLLPNAAMPEHIRLVHAFEIGISYCLFGYFLGYVFATYERHPQRSADVVT